MAVSKHGLLIPFDVLVERGMSKDKAFKYGKFWLANIGEHPEDLDQSRCHYGHSENINTDIESAINNTGFYILQMEGCPNPV